MACFGGGGAHGGGRDGGGRRWVAWSDAGSDLRALSNEPILTGPYDPATREAKLVAARAAMSAGGATGLFGTVEAVSGAVFGASGGEDDDGETSTRLGDAQAFEYTPEAVRGDVEELAASTSNPNFAARMLGYERKTFGDMIHAMKDHYDLRGDDNVIWHDNGDFSFNGEVIDNMHNWAP